MSNAFALVLGLAGGLAVWHFVPKTPVATPLVRNGQRSGRAERGAVRSTRYALDGGRIITRDGQSLVRLERVDLGEERYALSPHQTDALGARIVRLLNLQGVR